jgi:hypothetical protein
MCIGTRDKGNAEEVWTGNVRGYIGDRVAECGKLASKPPAKQPAAAVARAPKQTPEQLARAEIKERCSQRRNRYVLGMLKDEETEEQMYPRETPFDTLRRVRRSAAAV